MNSWGKKERRKFVWLKLFVFLSFAINIGKEGITKPQEDGKVEKNNSEVVLFRDPLEPLNRGIFSLNRVIDKIVLEPIAHLYTIVIPQPVRRGIGNVLDNLIAPLGSVNLLLQGEGEKAAQQFCRFTLNTVFGIGGLFDVASEAGFPNQQTTFDKTLERYTFPSGPYLVLPVIGASDIRDAFGRLVDFVADPFTLASVRHHHRNFVYMRTGIDIIHTRSQHLETMRALEKSSPDLYITIRSIYQEKKNEGKVSLERPKPSSNGWD